MTRCAYCGKEVYLPYKCKFCGLYFCSEHHLPEKHNCIGLRIYKSEKNKTLTYLPYPTRKIFTHSESKTRTRINVKSTSPVYYSRKPKHLKSLKKVVVILAILVILWFGYSYVSNLSTIPTITITPEIIGVNPTKNTDLYQNVSVKELAKNPEAYVGKKVKTTGILHMYLWNEGPKLEGAIVARLRDKQGYWIFIVLPEEQRYWYQGGTYRVKGTFRTLKMKGLQGKSFTIYVLEVEEMYLTG